MHILTLVQHEMKGALIDRKHPCLTETANNVLRCLVPSLRIKANFVTKGQKKIDGTQMSSGLRYWGYTK